MDRLFAPWRMAYILGAAEKTEECILCAFPARPREERERHRILCSSPHGFVMMNKFPYSNGHVLVAPRRHASSLDGLDRDEQGALAALLADTVGAIKTALGPDGLNIGMNLGRVAGAGIPEHLHWHVVPRWSGDVNFMAVVGETRVIGEHLDATFAGLRPHFAPFDQGASS